MESARYRVSLGSAAVVALRSHPARLSGVSWHAGGRWLEARLSGVTPAQAGRAARGLFGRLCGGVTPKPPEWASIEPSRKASRVSAGGGRPGLGEVLSGYWTARDRFVEAGLSTNRSNPAGGLAEALIAAALWPHHVIQDAYTASRAALLGRDASGRHGPALGSMPTTRDGKRNTLAVDLAVPWYTAVRSVPGLAGFAERRQSERLAWDTATGTGAPASAMPAPPEGARYSQMARVQVKSRFAPAAPEYENWNAVPFQMVRDGPIPGNDLYALVLFARIDEYQRDLHEANFVWTAVLITDECLRALDRGIRSGKLGWSEVLSWWEDGHGLPPGAHEIARLLREVPVPGW